MSEHTDHTLHGRKDIHDLASAKLDTELNVSELLRQVAEELEEQNDSRALSQMGRARLVRLVRDLRGARSLRHYEPRTDRTESFANGSYLTDGDSDD